MGVFLAPAASATQTVQLFLLSEVKVLGHAK